MRFLVDNQLPPRLSRFLVDAGHDSVHVSMVGLGDASDYAVWTWARQESRVVVRKDGEHGYSNHVQRRRGWRSEPGRR
jgi:predicted nuclease of predicted toxin-antitoxin system